MTNVQRGRRFRLARSMLLVVEIVTVVTIWIATHGFIAAEVGGIDALAVGVVCALAVVGFLRVRAAVVPITPSHVGDLQSVVQASLFGAGTAIWASLAVGIPVSLRSKALAIVTIALTIMWERGVYARLTRQFGRATRVVIVGAAVDCFDMAQLVRDHPESGLRLVGIVGNRETTESRPPDPDWIGETEDIKRLVSEVNASEAIVMASSFDTAAFRQIARGLHDSGVGTFLSTGVGNHETPFAEIQHLAHEPLVRLGPGRPQSTLELWLMRLIDTIGASIFLILCSPILAAAAVAIKLDDGGTVFYRSERVGKDEQTFGMLKLRSMNPGAESQKNELAGRNERSGPLFKVSNDPRITRVGRVLRETSIDELPQFVNVLAGDMSLVGPRPAIPDEVAQFDADLRERCRVRPGITGLWQVEARSNASFDVYRRLDLRYTNNASLLLNLQIIVATGIQILVSITMLPLSIFLPSDASDGINSNSAAPGRVIDLREQQMVSPIQLEQETDVR